jgi:MYXO-CTERM domain-containing protein
MTSLSFRTSILALALFGVVPPAAASIPVTTGETESDSDTFPDTDTGEPSLITIVEPANTDVFTGTPAAKVPVVIEFETGDGADVLLTTQIRQGGDGPWTTVKEDQCPAGPSPCQLELLLEADRYLLRANLEGPGGSIGSDIVIIDVVEAEATDTDASGSAGETAGETTETGGETGTAPTSSATGDSTGETPGGATTSETTDDPSASGGDPADGEKGCACTTGATGPDILGLALAALLVPWRRRQR